MDFYELIRTRRTIRQFKDRLIARNTLVELLEAARSAPSAANLQPLEYIIIEDAETVKKVFGQLAWAGYVQPKRNPPQDKRPVAYIVVLVNHDISPANLCIADAAAAIENILLAAWSKGIGSCWIGSVQRDNVRRILAIPERLDIDSVVALGYPDETPVIEDAANGAIKYYLDESDRLHVPKRKLIDITHLNRFGSHLK